MNSSVVSCCMCCLTGSSTFAVTACWPIVTAQPGLPPAAGYSASSSRQKKRPKYRSITVTVTSDSPASRYAIALSAEKATWSASKPFCLVHFHVRRHALIMFANPPSHHYRSRFHSLLVATRPDLRHRVFAVYPPPGICLIHLTRTTFAPPSSDRRPRLIVARCPANACAARWITAATIQCP